MIEKIGIGNKKDLKLYVFSTLMALTYVVHLFLFVNNPTGMQSQVFFAGFRDLFADFFNCCILVSGKDPYFMDYVFQSNYLPLANLIFYPFSCLADYKNFTLQDCWNSQIAMFSCFYFILVSVLLLVHSIICLCNKYGTNKIIILPFLFSSVFLYLLERGNILILSCAFLFYFLAFYDSENKFLAYFAAICLAVAAVIKVYPVLFGILYLSDWKFYLRRISAAFLSFLILAFLPFLFFEHGFANLPHLFEILSGTALPVTETTTRFDLKYCGYRVLCLLKKKEYTDIVSSICQAFTYCLSLVSLVIAIFEKKHFKKMCLITFSVLYLPPFSWVYCAMYCVPVAVCYFGNEYSRSLSDDADSESNKNDVRKQLLYILLFYSIFIPFGMYRFKNINLRSIMINFSTLIFWCYLVGETFFSIGRNILKKKIPENSKINLHVFFQFVKFCLVGVSNTMLSYVIYLLLTFLGLQYILANIIGFTAGVLNAFFWNNRYVFKKSPSEQRSALLTLAKTFLTYAGTNLLLSNILLVFLVEWCGISKFIAPLISLFVTIPLNFLLNKFWAFRTKMKSSSEETSE